MGECHSSEENPGGHPRRTVGVSWQVRALLGRGLPSRVYVSELNFFSGAS